MGIFIFLLATIKSLFNQLACSIMLILLVFLSSQKIVNAQTETLQIAVLYPTVSKEYSGMFDQLISGINSVPGTIFRVYRVNQNTTSEDIKRWSDKLNISGYIALGQTTYKLIDSLDSDLPLVAGGMVATPPGISGISLSSSPKAFFKQLKSINPKISRVFFVYSKRNNGWLVAQARELSKQYGIEFIPLQVNDFKQATLQYQIVLNSVRSETDAIWLPLDNVSPLNILLPEILQVSWDRNVTVFSNNLLHTKRGTLFALYPDHYKQGIRLVKLLQRYIDKSLIGAMLFPSIDLKTAINVRTATHLNIKFTREELKKFDQLYPSYK